MLIVVREKIWAAARAAKALKGDVEDEEEEGVTNPSYNTPLFFNTFSRPLFS